MIKLPSQCNLYIYARISSKNNCSKYSNFGSISLDFQIENCKKYANKNKIEILESNIYTDIGTGKDKNKRPKFKNMLEKLYQNSNKDYKVILVNDVSRFFRNKELGLYELNKLSSQNICVISVTEYCHFGPYSNLVNRKKFRNLLERSELELNTITTRIRNSIAFRRKRGDYFGVAPFGYKAIRNESGKRYLIESENEKKIIELIFNRNKKGMKIKDIVDELNKLQLLKRNKIWKINSVKNIIKNNDIFKKLSCKKRQRVEIKSNYNLRKTQSRKLL